ncbi:minichromosome maintenance protein MCM [Methanonatronarchaeum sp. AMET-Sl]|uniref:minichromosome maintenance protein MCM n=1 Tax=Methanonatronarchaeum sp. AMET-Sl TaxID=3037654 RepID=UPI00244DFF4B|nr:minichromosome maintenance protein MCM [Methanonatronarchaeum sp. AMET-Sl]WGI17793.1 minichromosome maintenance protein MCM [Methanonatronarchaeum sp. AMET-Sl]
MSATVEESLETKDIEEKFKEFFEKYYQTEIKDLVAKYPNEKSLYVHYNSLLERFDPEFADRLIKEPDKFIKGAQDAIKNTDIKLQPQIDGGESQPSLSEALNNIYVRFVELPSRERTLARNLRSHHINKFVSIDGIVKRATEVRPKLIDGVFKCLRCGKVMEVPQDGGSYQEPYQCADETCQRKNAFELIVEESDFIDSQKLQIQERPEDLRGAEQPQDLNILVEDDLTGEVVPGNRVIINGVLRSSQKQNRNSKSTVFDVYVECNSIELMDREFEDLEITVEEEREIEELSNDPDVYSKIIDSIAPTIYGYRDVKEAMALQLFGGVAKELPDGSRIRGDIHTFLVGDPGIGKSQILRYVSNLAPRGVYASGKSSTSAGLTAAAVKDEFGDGKWTLEAGALVLADKGVATIDEMDKMNSRDRSALHEAMEQQSISIAKAGITSTLKSRCALLGAANPKYGRFDRYEPIADQIDMEPSLLSRFDLIFTLTDKPDKKKDERIANHIIKSHYAGEISMRSDKSGEEETALEDIEPAIEPELMRKYIAHSKQITPVLTDDAKQELIDFYLELREIGEDDNSPVPVTARQLEALVRLAEASARTRLNETVEVIDADRATTIVNKCLKEVGMDPETGQYDIDMLTTGTSKSQRDKIRLVKEVIESLEGDEGAPRQDVIGQAEQEGIDRDEVKDIIKKLREKGDIIEPRPGKTLRTT